LRSTLEKNIETVPVQGFCSPEFSIISVLKTIENLDMKTKFQKQTNRLQKCMNFRCIKWHQQNIRVPPNLVRDLKG
jgi:hypothetical protein